jgi:hypothetical protein
MARTRRYSADGKLVRSPASLQGEKFRRSTPSNRDSQDWVTSNFPKGQGVRLVLPEVDYDATNVADAADRKMRSRKNVTRKTRSRNVAHG